MRQLSVIIPTYNNKKKLKKALQFLEQQKFKRSKKPKLEVIVVDDGSTDGTPRVMPNLIKKIRWPLRYYQQVHKGPATARNLGIKNANGKIVLFLDDDKMPAPNLIEEHLLSHRRYRAENVAVLGFTTWAENLKVTPFMWWMEHGGHQFKYDEIKDKKWVDYRYFFTGNLSLKKDFLLKKGLFDEAFGAAYEDLELGYRLQKRGLKILYNPKAKNYHDHPTSLTNACQKMERVGKWSRLYNQKVPTSKRLPSWSELLILMILANPVVYLLLRLVAGWCEKRIAFGLLFNALLLAHYLKGRRQ